MLAEPRRRQKYSTDPRGLNWANDETKFGQKLLEKMGWEKGKGLGAKEDGRTEHVKVTFKSDNKGVGCKKSQADNWIAHQDDFNALLSSLNADHSVDTGPANQSSVQNLEDKSKTAKGRVHYKKFTRGKDLSGLHETDFNCIFGKRKAHSQPATPQQQSSASSSDTEETQSENGLPSMIAEPQEDNFHGVKTIIKDISVADYFAEKMAKFRAASKLNNNGKQEETHGIGSSDCIQETTADGHDRGPIFTTDPCSGLKTQPDAGSSEKLCSGLASEMAKLKGKKKKKKVKAETEAVNLGKSSENSDCEMQAPDQNQVEKELQGDMENGSIEEPSRKRKKSKKRKHEQDAGEENSSSKLGAETHSPQVLGENHIEDKYDSPKTKKIKKHVVEQTETLLEGAKQSEIDATNNVTRKKKKQKKERKSVASTDAEAVDQSEKSKKSSKQIIDLKQLPNEENQANKQVDLHKVNAPDFKMQEYCSKKNALCFDVDPSESKSKKSKKKSRSKRS